MGREAAERAVKERRAVLILTVSGVSERTKRGIGRISGGIPAVEVSFERNEVEAVFTRYFAVAAITDVNFRDLFLRALEDGGRHKGV